MISSPCESVIIHLHQAEPLRFHRDAGHLPVTGGDDVLHRFRTPLSEAHLEEGPGHDADLVLQEAGAMEVKTDVRAVLRDLHGIDLSHGRLFHLAVTTEAFELLHIIVLFVALLGDTVAVIVAVLPTFSDSEVGLSVIAFTEVDEGSSLPEQEQMTPERIKDNIMISLPFIIKILLQS